MSDQDLPALRGRVRFGALELDLETGELRRDGAFVPLQRQVARTLVLLVSRGGRLVPREELIEHLWDGTVVEYEQGLNNTIRTLRASLGDDARSPRYIGTEPRRGYRFLAVVEPAEPAGLNGNPAATAPAPTAEPTAVAAAVPARAAETPAAAAAPAGRGPILVPAAAAASALALVVALGSLFVVTRRPAAAPPTVAVLPFTGSGPNGDVLGAALSEELTRELAVVPGAALRVVGPASAARAFREESELRRVAARLGASHLVVGSLVNRGNALTLDLRLLRAADASIAWQERIAPSWADVLTEQRSLAHRIAARISRGLGLPETHPVLPASPRSVAHYLEGRHLLGRGAAAEAEPLLEAVVTAEPGFAPARVALGEAILAAPDAGRAARARRLAGEALRLSPRDARAHLLLARVALGHEWDWAVAERHLSRARRLAPGDSSVYLATAFYLASLARHREALEASAVARELDPLSAIVQGDLAMLHFWAEDWEGVLRESERLLELQPDSGVARSLRLEALMRQRRWQQARALAIEIAGPDSGLETVDGPELRVRYLMLQEERWASAEPSALRAMLLASLAAELGREEEALRLLAEAVRRRSPYVPFVAVDPHFRGLADRAELRELLASVHHPLALRLPPLVHPGNRYPR